MRFLIIFDLDGTLVDSVRDLAEAVNAALSEIGLPIHEVEMYYRFVGNGSVKLCERALPEDMRSEDNIRRLHDMFSANYAEGCLKNTKPYEGIPLLLAKIKEQGISCAVASNKPEVFTKRVIASLFDEGIFDYVVGKRDGAALKPDPQIVNDIITALGADRSRCIYAGDSDVDILTAHNAGIECIGCAWGFRGADELSAAGADYIAYDPLDILKWL